MSENFDLNNEDINKSLEELESLIKDNQASLEKENVDIDSFLNIFKEINNVQKDIEYLSKQLHDSTNKTNRP